MIYIKKCRIDAFGVLRDREITLSPTLNIIEGENESGKSALAMFIKFMLYGLSGRSTGGELSERRRYVNWDTGTAAGSMLLVENDREIRVERTLRVSTLDDGARNRESVRESVRVLDAASGAPLYRGEIPGEAIFGVPENVFMNTVFVRQIDGTRPAGTGVLTSIENLLFSADEHVGTQKALDRLEEGRRQILHKNENGGALAELRTERSHTAAQLAEAGASGSILLDAEKELSRADEACAELDEQIRRQERIVACGEVNLLKRRFDAAATAVRKLDGMRTELNTRQQKGLDRAYLSQLDECAARLCELSETISKLSTADAAAGEKVQEAERLTAEVETETENVLREAEHCLSRMRSMTAAACTLFFFAVLAGVGGWLLASIHVSLYPVPLVGAGALGFLGALSLFLRQRVSAQLQDQLREWGAVSTEELPRAVAQSMGNITNAADVRTEKRQIEAALTEAISRRRAEIDRAIALAGKAEIQCEDDPASDEALAEAAHAAVRAAHEQGEQYCQATETMQKEADALAGRLSLLLEELSGVSEAEVRHTFAENMKTVEGRIASGMDSARLDSARRELEEMQSRRAAALEEHHKLDTHLAATRAVRVSPTALAEKLSRLDAQIEELSTRHEAYCLAIETMTRASERVRAGVLPRIVQDACASANRLSDGRFEAIGIDHGLQMSFTRGGQTRSVEYLSEGTKDLAYISLRRALCRSLFGKNCPPLIYDESFARIDEGRLSRILAMLDNAENGESQSIVLSCRRLEAELVLENGGARVIRL